MTANPPPDKDELFICRRTVGGSDEGTRYFQYEEVAPYAPRKSANDAVEAMENIIFAFRQRGWEEYVKEAEKVKAALTSEPVAGWRPIETAPTTGKQMILLLTPSRFPQVAFSNTWWTAGFSVENKPTHWMEIEPLPAPPHTEERG